RAYLFVVARNMAFDVIRHNEVISIDAVADIEQLAVVDERADIAEHASHDQELEILAEAIATLPPRCREIFILRRYHDLSHKEIAQKLGVAENTVNAQLVTAMLRCREYLRASGVTQERSHAHERA
ncbi:MAG: RNA polymerase sigma factor, partial [Opitutaceae bacterium]